MTKTTILSTIALISITMFGFSSVAQAQLEVSSGRRVATEKSFNVELVQKEVDCSIEKSPSLTKKEALKEVHRLLTCARISVDKKKTALFVVHIIGWSGEFAFKPADIGLKHDDELRDLASGGSEKEPGNTMITTIY